MQKLIGNSNILLRVIEMLEIVKNKENIVIPAEIIKNRIYNLRLNEELRIETPKATRIFKRVVQIGIKMTKLVILESQKKSIDWMTILMMALGVFVGTFTFRYLFG